MDITNFKRNTPEPDENSWDEWLSDAPMVPDDLSEPETAAWSAQGKSTQKPSNQAHVVLNDGLSTPQAIRRGATAKVSPGGVEERQTIAIQIHMPYFHLPKWNIPRSSCGRGCFA